MTSNSAYDVVAVDRISFEALPGELVVLLGESGCGKTTTLKLINRLIDPTSGTITVEGQPLSTLDPVELRRGIGYVNITDITRNGLTQKDLVASDELHPSAEAYKLFVERIFPFVTLPE